MIYYKVKNDGFSILEADSGNRHYLIKDELITVAELSNYELTNRQMNNIFDVVEIPKTKTIWCFGTRFIMKGYENEAKIKASNCLD